MEHKELRQLLDAMIRSAKLSFEKSGNLPPFAMSLNDQGKIAQLALPNKDRSADQTTKAIESGVGMVAQQLTCKAVGFCSEVRLNDLLVMQVVFILEHRDGCAYRIVIPDLLDAKHWEARRTEPRFFANTKFFSASTRW